MGLAPLGVGTKRPIRDAEGDTRRRDAADSSSRTANRLMEERSTAGLASGAPY